MSIRGTLGGGATKLLKSKLKSMSKSEKSSQAPEAEVVVLLEVVALAVGGAVSADEKEVLMVAALALDPDCVLAFVATFS